MEVKRWAEHIPTSRPSRLTAMVAVDGTAAWIVGDGEKREREREGGTWFLMSCCLSLTGRNEVNTPLSARRANAGSWDSGDIDTVVLMLARLLALRIKSSCAPDRWLS